MQVLELSGGGFQLLRDTLVSYKSLSAKPSTDGDKINTWVLQQSKVAGTNFGPYYRAWKWPVTDATMATLAGLNLKAFPIPSNFNLASPPPSPSPPRPPLAPKPPLVVPSRCEDYATLTKGGWPHRVWGVPRCRWSGALHTCILVDHWIEATGARAGIRRLPLPLPQASPPPTACGQPTTSPFGALPSRCCSTAAALCTPQPAGMAMGVFLSTATRPSRAPSPVSKLLHCCLVGPANAKELFGVRLQRFLADSLLETSLQAPLAPS